MLDKNPEKFVSQDSKNQEYRSSLTSQVELELSEYSIMATFWEDVLVEYTDLCNSVDINPKTLNCPFSQFLNPLENSDLSAVLTSYPSLFEDVKDNLQSIAETIKDDPQSKIKALLDIIKNYPDENSSYRLLVDTSSVELAESEKKRLFERIMLEVAVGFRVLGDQTEDIRYYLISKDYFDNVIKFAIQNGDLPLLVEALRHSVNLHVSMSALHQNLASKDGVNDTEREVHNQESTESIITAKYLALLASSMFNVLQRKDKAWAGKGELLAFDKDFTFTLLALFSEQSNVIYALLNNFPKSVRKIILKFKKDTLRYRSR